MIMSYHWTSYSYCQLY